MKRFKAVLFDLDGTLLDTSEGIISTLRQTVEHLHFRELTDAELRGFIGPPLPTHISEVFGFDEEGTVDAVRYFRKIYSGGEVYRARVYDGIPEVIDELKKKGIKVAAATYKKEDIAISLLHRKGLTFDVIHGADTEGRLTKADIIRMTIDELGVTPQETVMVGDSENDAVGAAAAGTAFIGVTYGFGFESDDDVTAPGTIGVAHTAAEIVSML